MTEKIIRTALVFGGRSAEHDVSILSARSVRDAAPRSRLDVIPICIARDGRFLDPDASRAVLDGSRRAPEGDPSFSFEAWLREGNADVVFPVTHGTFGEDGSLQGYLEILGVAYVGSGVTASAVGMDKGMMKQAFHAARLPLCEYVVVRQSDWEREPDKIRRTIENAVRLPYFVKPANAGSSVGVSKVKSDDDLEAAIGKAFRFDDKVLVERGIDAREIEVSVLGNDDPDASVPGEIVTGREFYDYEDKYIDDKSSLVIPAKLSPEKAEEFRRLAITAYKAVGAAGFARVDFFLERGTNRIFINEINTIPGFTRISMYPKLWEATEIKYGRLIEKLIHLAIERHQSRSERLEGMMRFFDDVRELQ